MEAKKTELENIRKANAKRVSELSIILEEHKRRRREADEKLICVKKNITECLKDRPILVPFGSHISQSPKPFLDRTRKLFYFFTIRARSHRVFALLREELEKC